jgi:hypothetical protein
VRTPSDAFGFGCEWAAGVAGVDGAAGLDQQDGCFLFGAGAVLDTSGDDVEAWLSPPRLKVRVPVKTNNR